MNFRKMTAFGLGLPWLVTLGFFWAFPIIYSFVVGFTDNRLLTKVDAAWVGWQNYIDLFADTEFLSALENSFFFVAGTVPITTVIALLLALLVNRKFAGRGLFRAGFFLPSITAMVVIAMIFTNLYRRGGYVALLADMIGLSTPEHGLLYSSTTALTSIMAMDIWMSCGYYMLIFLAGLKSIPDELYEAAEINGASTVRQFFSITLPLLRPVALFIIVINSIKSFQVFVEIFIMTKGKFDSSTLVYFIYDRGLTTGFEFGYASAAAVILFGIIALISAVQFILLRQRRPLW